MTYEARGALAPDYLPCRYGASRLMFRGPKRRLEGEFIAVLGSTETYGKFIETPYPRILEDGIQTPVVNFGCLNAGVDAFAHDPVIIDAANSARAVIVQVMGAQNMSNRLYTVHPRRNDRFLNASSLLKAVYREVDFTEFHFTRHMLTTLRDIDAARFAMVRDELKQAWCARMRLLLSQINKPMLLLWFAGQKPPEVGQDDENDPLYVDSDMLEMITAKTAGIIEVVPSDEAREEGITRMMYDPMDKAAAFEQLSVMAHEEAAQILGGALAPMLMRSQ
ncbi:DUF6473 family protein [Primorskyibacter sp. S187A]|uniref:DUF6473 family protein n=1 Tax=Primorskyibacter sp. S187A TaxID=3415130 RepID=UPI003C7D3490